jgi:hypothetical protein
MNILSGHELYKQYYHAKVMIGHDAPKEWSCLPSQERIVWDYMADRLNYVEQKSQIMKPMENPNV